ncbi:MAG TPA: hypothetical protein VFB38_10260 [Chthonomonadaceae bacterium]|nr:hypothetical protein [Chthonomonadaceae bacterium]
MKFMSRFCSPGARGRQARRSVWIGTGMLALACAAALPAARAQQTAPSPQSPAADNRTFTLASHFEKGQISRYQTQGAMTLSFNQNPEGGGLNSGLTTGFDITFRYKVLETQPNGSTLLSIISEGGKQMNPPDPPISLPKEPDNYPRTATLDRQDKVLELKDPPRAAAGGALEGLFGQQSNILIQLHFLPLPEKPIKVGDTWSVRYSRAGARQEQAHNASTSENADAPGTVQERLTLLGTEKVGDQETLKIKQEITLPFEGLMDAEGKPTTDAKKAAGHVTAHIEFTQMVNALPTDGQVLRSQGDIGGWVKFEGEVAKQLPNDTVHLGGKLSAVRLPDKGPVAAPPGK